MRIYLDNNATTRIHSDVLETLEQTQRDVFGNPSSVHREGQIARRVVEEARDGVAGLIHSSPREIVFTSGGTESSNAAIFGVLGDSNLCHIVTTSIEHPSVLEPVKEAERRGASVTCVRPGRNGAVAADEVINAIRPDTRLVSVMLANNETGVVQPVGPIAEFCRANGVHFHCDAVQAAGKIKIDVNALNVDTLALSAHKFHAPKGAGALFVRSGVSLKAFLFGGSQERRRRAGTENPPYAAAMGRAAQVVSDLEPMREVERLRNRMEEELGAALPNVRINGGGAQRLPNTSNISFSGTDAEAVVIGLDLQGVAVSTGSACSSGRVEPSRILVAMGVSDDDAKSSVRISLSRFTTAADIDRVVALLKELVPRNLRVAASVHD